MNESYDPSADPHASDRPARGRWRDSLGWVAYVALGLFMAFVSLRLYGRIVNADGNELAVSHALGELAGALLGTVLLASIVSAICFYVARRSRLGSNLGFAGAVFLIFVGQLGQISREPQLKDEFEAIRQDNLRSNLALLEDAASNDGYIEDGAGHMGERIDQMEAMAARTRGDERALLEALATVMRDLQRAVAELEAASTAFDQTAAVDPSALTSPERIAESRAALMEYRATVDAMLAQVDDIETNVREAAMRRSVPAAYIDGAIQGLRQAGELDNLREMRLSDLRLIEAMDGQLAIYESEFGRWSFDETGSLIFENEHVEGPFSAHYDAIQREVAVQDRLLQDIIEIQRQKLRDGSKP